SSSTSSPSAAKNPSSTAATAGKYEFEMRSGTAMRILRSGDALSHSRARRLLDAERDVRDERGARQRLRAGTDGAGLQHVAGLRVDPLRRSPEGHVQGDRRWLARGDAGPGIEEHAELAGRGQDERGVVAGASGRRG